MGNAKSVTRLVVVTLVVVLATPFIVPPPLNSEQAGHVYKGDNYRNTFTAVFSKDDLTFDKFMEFDVIMLKKADFLGDAGKPMLPSKEIRIALADGMTVKDVQVVATTEEEIPGEFNVFPSQPPKTIDMSDKDVDLVEPDREIYASDEPYPPRLFRFAGQTDLAGQSIAVIELYPLRYVASQKRLVLCTSVTFAIQGTGGYVCGDYLPRKVSGMGRHTYEQMIRDMVENPEDVQLRTGPVGKDLSVLPDGQFEHVIITSDAYASYFQPLVDWHNRRGLKDTVVMTNWIYSHYAGADSQKVRSFITDAHSDWGATYFLIGGEKETVPFSFRTYLTEAGSTPSDQYYSDFDDDWIHEVFVGRVSVGNTSEVTTFVDKVLKYERNPPRKDYPLDILLVGMDYDDNTHGERVKQDIDTSYIPSRFNVTKVYDSHVGNHKDSIIHYLGAGQNLVNHTEHAGVTAIGAGYHNHGWLVLNAQVDALANNGKLSILLSTGCDANQMDYDDCIAEHFVIYNPDQAGVAFIGNTRLGAYSLGNPIGLSDALDRKWWMGLFGSNKYNLGQTLVYSKHNFSTDLPQEKHCEWTLNLLGEPEMPIWTDEPSILSVTHPSGLPAGVTSLFPVNVEDSITLAPVESAYVCLWKGDEVYLTGHTNGTGWVQFNPSPATEGITYVTVTKHNYIPYEGEANAVFILPPDITQLDSTYVPWATIGKYTDGQALLGIRMDNASEIDHLESVVLKSFIERAFSVDRVRLYGEHNQTKGLQIPGDSLIVFYDTRNQQFDTGDTLKLSGLHYPLSAAPDSNLFYVAVDAHTDSISVYPAVYHAHCLEIIVEPGKMELTSGTNPDTVYNRPNWTAPEPLATGFVPGNPPLGRYRLCFDTDGPPFDMYWAFEVDGCKTDAIDLGDSLRIWADTSGFHDAGDAIMGDITLDLSPLGLSAGFPLKPGGWDSCFTIPDAHMANCIDVDPYHVIYATAQDSLGNEKAVPLSFEKPIDTCKPKIDSIQFFITYDRNSDGIAGIGDSLAIVAWALSNADFEADSMIANLSAYFPDQPSKRWQQLDDVLNNNRLFRKKFMLEEDAVEMTADSAFNRLTIWAWDNACNYDTLQRKLNAGFDLYPFVIKSSPSKRFVRAGQLADYDVTLTTQAETPSPCTLTVTGIPPFGSAEFDPRTLVPTDSSLMTVYTTDNTPTGSYDLTVTAAELGKAKAERSVQVALIVTESDTLWIRSRGKVDLIVTDPVRDSISLATNTIQDATYETPTDTTDVVTIPLSLVGEYRVRVVRWQGAEPAPADSYAVCIRIDGSAATPPQNASIPPADACDEYGYAGLPYVRGDLNGDGQINIGDVVFMLNYLFKRGLPPYPLELGDVNCDGVVNLADVIYMLNYLFKGGNPPCSGLLYGL